MVAFDPPPFRCSCPAGTACNCASIKVLSETRPPKPPRAPIPQKLLRQPKR